MYITDFTYKLINPVKFANNGKQDEIDYLVLSSPSANQLQHSRQLKQFIMRGIIEVSSKQSTDNNDDEKKGKINSEIVLLMIYGSSIDVNEYFNSFKRLLKTGIAKINGTDIELIPDLYDKLCGDDIDNILGEYVENFLIPSIMKNN